MKKGSTKLGNLIEKQKGVTRAAPGKPPKNEIISKTRIANALMKVYGVRAEAAKLLKCTPGNLTYRINKDPDLLTIQTMAEDTFHDTIDYNIKKDVLEKTQGGVHKDDTPWVKWYAEHKMKSRGYSKVLAKGEKKGDVVIQILPAGAVQEIQGEIEDAEFEDLPDVPEEENEFMKQIEAPDYEDD